jgi:DNA-directed RNA polymerase specialized sigma subunit
MDFVQIATEGLLAAIDKFVLPYSNVFRCVAIGRMLGNFIEAYSETTLHFYPTDRRKVYRANKYLSKHQFDIDYEDLAATVNSDVKGSGFSTNPSEIYNLVTAVSCVSANTKIPSPVRGSAAGVENITQYAAEDNSRPDVQYEVRQALHMLEKEVSKLNLVEKKLLKLKGIDFALAVS